jgi:RNA polymerase sigma factor (sigma-70 family)
MRRNCAILLVLTHNPAPVERDLDPAGPAALHQLGADRVVGLACGFKDRRRFRYGYEPTLTGSRRPDGRPLYREEWTAMTRATHPGRGLSTVDPDRADAELLAQLPIGGETARLAWAVLVDRYSCRLYAVARSFSVDEATAEDLVQTAWLRLLERGEQVRDPAAVGAWLATVVRNEARRRLARRREIPTDVTLNTRPDGADPVDSRLIRDERVRALGIAFAHVGRECQQLLRLLVAEPAPSYDEIAAAVGRPRGSLGPTRRRCLERLRARLPAGFES